MSRIAIKYICLLPAVPYFTLKSESNIAAILFYFKAWRCNVGAALCLLPTYLFTVKN